MTARIISLIITGIILLVLSIAYIKYVILDDYIYPFRVYVKWIPAAVLLLSTGLTGLYLIKCEISNLSIRIKSHIKFYVILLWVYACCITGDILLCLGSTYYLGGMVSFMIGYILISILHLTHSYPNLNLLHTKKLLVGCWIIAVITMTVVAFIIKTDSEINHKFDSIADVIGIIVYATVIASTEICCLAYYLTSHRTHRLARWHVNLGAILLITGVSLFIISDIMVIFNDITVRSKFIEIADMMLYWLSLYLIYGSVIVHEMPRDISSLDYNILGASESLPPYIDDVSYDVQ